MKQYSWAPLIISPLTTAGGMLPVIFVANEYVAGKIGTLNMPARRPKTHVRTKMPGGKISVAVMYRHARPIVTNRMPTKCL